MSAAVWFASLQQACAPTWVPMRRDAGRRRLDTRL
jgi:hypothetical protein